MKTAVLTVIYPKARPYLNDLLGSLQNQTDRDFTFVVVNDGLAGLEKKLKKTGSPFKMLADTGTPAHLRKIGIRWACRMGFDAIIFLDADDRMDSRRVETVKKMLSKHAVVFNDLVLFGRAFKRPTPLLSRRFKEGGRVRAQDLLTMNCLGLSNTSVRTDVTGESARLVPDSIRAFDWAFFTRILLKGREAVFTRKTRTYYRQHAANTAPFAPGEKDILAAVRIKADHYKALKSEGQKYGELAKTFSKLAARLSRDRSFKKTYCSAVRNARGRYPLWWEMIKDEKELGL